MYESSTDRANERDVILRAAIQWPDLSVVRLPRAYPVDYWGSVGSKGAMIEIKCRNYTMQHLDEMGGLILSLQKWSAAHALSKAATIPLKVWLRTNDGYWQHSTMDFQHDGVRVAGRTDRGDPEDIEPCITLRGGRFGMFGRRA